MFKSKKGKAEPEAEKAADSAVEVAPILDVGNAPPVEVAQEQAEPVVADAVLDVLAMKTKVLALVEKHVLACQSGASVGLHELRKLRAEITAL